MKAYFAYIRVSTVRQGEHGSSLQEQREAIVAFAARNGLTITEWFEEQETAAKTGRREFSRLLGSLKAGRAAGVIFHKIDRSVRNLSDWSQIQDLADRKIDVRFTQESIDLGSNEGRLTGDFLAVISSHYVRNLREEVKKGIRGRLKQGFYPFAAPLGYLDRGAAKAKELDPITAPLVRYAFERYASGEISLNGLSDELYSRGLRNRANGKVKTNRLSDILRNPFYAGCIRIKKTGDVYIGVHDQIVSKELFDRTKSILSRRFIRRTRRHSFLFRRMLRCARCGYFLTGEKQKEQIYYRCHSRNCPKTLVREDIVSKEVMHRLEAVALTSIENDELASLIDEARRDSAKAVEDRRRALQMQLQRIEMRRV